MCVDCDIVKCMYDVHKCVLPVGFLILVVFVESIFLVQLQFIDWQSVATTVNYSAWQFSAVQCIALSVARYSQCIMWSAVTTSANYSALQIIAVL